MTFRIASSLAVVPYAGLLLGLGAALKIRRVLRLVTTPYVRPPVAAGQVWGRGGLRLLWVVDVFPEAGPGDEVIPQVVYRDDREPWRGAWRKDKVLPLAEIEKELVRLRWRVVGDWMAEQEARIAEEAAVVSGACDELKSAQE